MRVGSIGGSWGNWCWGSSGWRTGSWTGRSYGDTCSGCWGDSGSGSFCRVSVDDGDTITVDDTIFWFKGIVDGGTSGSS